MQKPTVITAHRDDWATTARRLARRPPGWVATRIDATATHRSYLVSPTDRVVVMMARTPDMLAAQLRQAGFRRAVTDDVAGREVWYDAAECAPLAA